MSALDFPANPTNGQIYEQFFWDATAGIWRNRQIVAVLDNLANVNVPNPLTNEPLIFDGSNWVNADIFAPRFAVETAERTTNYTVTMDDINKVVRMNGLNLTVTIPTNASVPFPIGTLISAYNENSTNLTVDGASGVTVRNARIITQFREISMRKRAENEWILSGGVL